MKILHVIPSFYPAYYYGGPIESSYQLCRHLAQNGCEVRVLTTDANGPDKVLDVENDREVKLAEGLRVRYCKRLVRDSVSPTLLCLLPVYIRWADAVHLTAVYSFPTIPTLLASKALSKPVVWSPRGSLEQWEGSTRPVLKAGWVRVCQAVRPKRLVLHVTSEDEAHESLAKFPGTEAPIIPNGVKIPKKVSHTNGNGVLRLFYLGRLHPIKGIENLLSACKILNETSAIDWSLSIAGAGNQDYAESIRAKIKELSLFRQVKMLGEVVGEDKRSLFEKADIVVAPSYTENFGMVVAEALAHGVPVIASQGTPWRRVEQVGCGLWVENSPENLAEAIQRLSRMPMHEMGERGREWMKRDFAWELVTARMTQLYERLSARL